MMILVTGGSGSGKSAYAEEVVESLSDSNAKFYIATMIVYGEEGQKKVERHRKLRAGKGFITVERARDIGGISEDIFREAEYPVALLECMSNLVANEMFTENGQESLERVVTEVLQGVEKLQSDLYHLVIVTNNVFEDGIAYDPSTTEYMRALGIINQRLAAMADQVVEVVVGIPVKIKEADEEGYNDTFSQSLYNRIFDVF